MWHSFLASWPLFHFAYLAGWLIAVVLAVLGVAFVAQDQIFVGAAAAQSSTFGIALILWLATTRLGWEPHDPRTTLLGRVASVLAAAVALILTRARPSPGGDTPEARTGGLYLLASALAILVVNSSPLGLNEVYRLLSSSLIGAEAVDVAIWALLATVVLGLVVILRNQLGLLLLDAPFADAVGLRIERWWSWLLLVAGTALGLAISVAGTLYAFACLVIPAMAARPLVRTTQGLFWAAPLVALLTSAVGFMLANRYDLPPAQAAVALLCLCYFLSLAAAAWFKRR